MKNESKNMQRYEGTKAVLATAMTRVVYNHYRGWKMPIGENPDDEGYLVEYEDSQTKNHENHDNYISWSPKDVFDRAYKLTPLPDPARGTKDFDWAISALSNGNKVKLPEWTGYWFAHIPDQKTINEFDVQKGTHLQIMVMTKDGEVIDTPWIDQYRDRTDWEVTSGSLGFDWAINALKNGKKVSRRGWNGSGMYAIMMPGYPDGIVVNETTRTQHNLNEGDVLVFRPYFQLFTAQKDVAMWTPSGSDVLAEDWELAD